MQVGIMKQTAQKKQAMATPQKTSKVQVLTSESCSFGLVLFSLLLLINSPAISLLGYCRFDLGIAFISSCCTVSMPEWTYAFIAYQLGQTKPAAHSPLGRFLQFMAMLADFLQPNV